MHRSISKTRRLQNRALILVQARLPSRPIRSIKYIVTCLRIRAFQSVSIQNPHCGRMGFKSVLNPHQSKPFGLDLFHSWWCRTLQASSYTWFTPLKPCQQHSTAHQLNHQRVSTTPSTIWSYKWTPCPDNCAHPPHRTTWLIPISPLFIASCTAQHPKPAEKILRRTGPAYFRARYNI